MQIRSRQLLTALGVIALFGLLAPVAALAGIWEFEPKEELIFTEVGQEKSVTLTNIGGGSVKIKEVTVGSESLYIPSRACQGAVLGQCTETVKCIKSGNAYITFHPEPLPPTESASILMKC